MKLTALLLLLTMPAMAQDPQMPRLNTWKASVAVLGIAQGLDIASSYGNVGREQNPLFGDTFTGKDAAVKIAVAAAIIGVEYAIIRKWPRSKAVNILTIFNGGAAAVTGFTAGENHRRTR